MANPFLLEITPKNLLSFGPNPETIKLQSLNVLIGANGSGKSNFIEMISLLRSTPGEIRYAFRPSGISDWISKQSNSASAVLDVVVNNDKGTLPLRHILGFDVVNNMFVLHNEQIENSQPYPGKSDSYFYYRYQNGNPIVNVKNEKRDLQSETVLPNSSILFQRQDPEQYPEIHYLARNYQGIKIFREWEFGRNSRLRQPQDADDNPSDLKEDFSNLAMHLNYLNSFPAVRKKIREKITDIFDGASDFGVDIFGNKVQLYLFDGEDKIPATRLSDGTLRYLCLLAILCNPNPCPLICLEEPELGLHPDLLSGLVDLIKECSERTQMIVTTHSEFLVDSFSNSPDCVIVVEREDKITEMRRLSPDALKIWLEEYTLGNLWIRGQLGGTRW
ncbi:AAA family ATPase [Armatimonas sp.]|uniref:AAA family ATPase n=1 Tax=Armatimonas sp. TaxID=1872638 RepID=UPI003752806F